MGIRVAKELRLILLYKQLKTVDISNQAVKNLFLVASQVTEVMSLKNSFVSERLFCFFFSTLFGIVDCVWGLGWYWWGGSWKPLEIELVENSKASGTM